MQVDVQVALVAAVPSLVSAWLAYRAQLASRETARHVGQSNGRGPVVKMLTDLQDWTVEHQAMDDAQADYLRRSLHDMRGRLANIEGMSWYHESREELKADLLGHDGPQG